MRLIRWTPFGDIERWFENEDFPTFRELRGTDFTPAVDVYQTKKDVVVETPLAGIDPEKVEIAVEDDVVTIRGKSEEEEKEEVKDKNYYRKEVRKGSFSRAVTLPCAVKGDKAKADSVDGMLRITIPKAERVKAKKIKVEVKKKK